MVEFWTPVDWLPYLPDFNLLDFSTCSILQVKVQATPLANLAALCPSIAPEWVRLAAKYICKACHKFLRYR
jgi:hypothetical protein